MNDYDEKPWQYKLFYNRYGMIHEPWVAIGVMFVLSILAGGLVCGLVAILTIAITVAGY